MLLPAAPNRGRIILVTSAVTIIGAMIATLTWLAINSNTTRNRANASPSMEQTPRYAGFRQPVADNSDPEKTGCAADLNVTDLDSVDIETVANNLLGVAELRYSPKCQVAWGRFEPSKPNDVYQKGYCHYHCL